MLLLFGLCPKTRRMDIRVNFDLASVPGPPGFLGGSLDAGSWRREGGGGAVTGADTADWAYSVGILCRFTVFLGTLHWPVRGFQSGASCPFRAMGCSEKVIKPHLRSHQEFGWGSGQAPWWYWWVPAMWCWFPHVQAATFGVESVLTWSYFQAFGVLPRQCLVAVCGVFGYPAAELPDGALKLRYCTSIFTVRFLPWSSPRLEP